jgi:CubicO group peptidase (beta-lactamase class C family)
MLVRVTYYTLTVLISGALCFIVGRIAHLSATGIVAFTVALSCYLLLTRPLEADPATLSATLETIRAQYKLPALAGAIFTTDGLVESAAVGVRRTGADPLVTANDLWHLGSDTKMMTAVLAGTFVVEKKLAWDAKVLSFFPELAATAPEAMRNITVSQVLSHRAGLIENLDWRALSQTGSLPQQRHAAALQALAQPAYAPGTYHYANTNYVVIGAILEKISGQPWEDLMRQRIFTPLGMTSAGFGGTGTIGEIDQPWPHFENGSPAPDNGPLTDNAEVMGPAGTVHCSMADWSKFLIDQLRGAAGLPAHFPAEIYTAMQTPATPGADYAYGWIVVQRPWAGGKALTHSGSNTMNFCLCWLAPAKKFGLLVCTNQGGQKIFPACDAAAGALIERYQQRSP